MDLKRLHFRNDVIIGILGYILNFLLIYLIRTKTTNELKAYSKILLLNCTIDLFFNTSTLLIMLEKSWEDQGNFDEILKKFIHPNILKASQKSYPAGYRAELRAGIIVFMNDGLTVYLPSSWTYYICAIFIGIYLFCILSGSIPFFYRYAIFCKSLDPSNKLAFKAYSVTFTLTSICMSFFILMLWHSEERHNAHIYIVNNSFWVDDQGNIPNFVSTNFTNPFYLLVVATVFVLASIMFGLILWCSFKIYSKLNEMKYLMNVKSLKIQKQLNVTLIVQALIPVIVSIIPIFILAIMVFLKTDIPGAALPMMMTLAWSSTLNPLCTIMLVAPFRAALFGKKIMKFCNTVFHTNIEAWHGA